jgi:hypothetical protein
MREGRGEARAWLITPLGAGKRTPVARIERRDAGGGSGDCAVFVGLCARAGCDAGWLKLEHATYCTGLQINGHSMLIKIARMIK